MRRATPRDLPRLRGLLAVLNAEVPGPPAGRTTPPGALRRALRAVAADRHQRLLVADAGEQVVGTCALLLVPNLSYGGRPWAHIENMVVAPEARGRGYGRALLAAALRIARRHGCYKIALTSNVARAAAHRFYEAAGFRHTHRGYTMVVARGR